MAKKKPRRVRLRRATGFGVPGDYEEAVVELLPDEKPPEGVEVKDVSGTTPLSAWTPQWGRWEGN